MNSFRKIEMFFNEKGEQIDSGGKVVKNSGLVRLIYDETVIICAKFMQVDSSEAIPETNAVQLNPHAAFSCFGDTGYQSESLLFLAQNNPDDPDDNCVNLPGDWLDNSTANPENGELSFRITTGNINFADALTGKQSRICQMVITATPPGCTECSVLALCQFYAYNRPSLQDFPPQQLSRDFLDANQIAALLAAAAEIQFAPDPDGSSVSSARRSNDNFIRFRSRAVNNAEWSPWIELFNGMSAYDIWLAQGNSGSTADFLNAIKGEPAQPVNDVEIDTANLNEGIFNLDTAQLKLDGQPTVQLFTPEGILSSANQNIRIQWKTESLSVDFSALEEPPEGVWRLKFGGGATMPNIITPADAVPVFYNSSRGFFSRLDQNTPVAYLTAFAENIIRIKIQIAAEEESSGTIAIQIRNRNAIIHSAVITIANTPAIQCIDLPEPVTGILSIHRQYGGDNDSIPGAAIISGIILESKR